MNLRPLSALAFALALSLAASAQNQSTPPPPTSQNSGPGQGQGQRGMRGGRDGSFGYGGGRGLAGTVTEVAADHYTIKNDAGVSYTIHFSVNTRILKQSAQRRAPGEGHGGQGQGQGTGEERGQGMGQGGANPPQPLKPTDIKVGDAVAAMGEVDETAKSVGAVMILQIDPERARQMAEMRANYGKTWLMGKVTAVDGVKVTLQGAIDSATHSFIADENTTFRKRRDPITLADIQLGDTLRVEGAIKDGTFLATAVNAMSPEATPTVPRQIPPQ